jgi:hypothetical protein
VREDPVTDQAKDAAQQNAGGNEYRGSYRLGSRRSQGLLAGGRLGR